jgi:YidC/Oxa1 family membrane protein insertase
MGRPAARKVFRFSDTDPYVITFSAEVTHRGAAARADRPLGPGARRRARGREFVPLQPARAADLLPDGDVTRVGQGDIPKYAVQEGHVRLSPGWTITISSARCCPAAAASLCGTRRSRCRPPRRTDARPASWTGHRGWPRRRRNARFFFGPKDFDVLAASIASSCAPSTSASSRRSSCRSCDAELDQRLRRQLRLVDHHPDAIINIMMFPLRHKSVVSMRKMQEIQPEVKAIQERYAKLKMTDPARQKMNAEMMNLYRERGVNPASGCVPMLLTLPVLIAFYSMLSVAIELRGAPFIGWIRTSRGTTRCSSRRCSWGDAVRPDEDDAVDDGPDAAEGHAADAADVHVLLPLGAERPGALLDGRNMWAIGQQALTNKLIGPMPQRTVRPPAERKLKSAGGGAASRRRRSGSRWISTSECEGLHEAHGRGHGPPARRDRDRDPDGMRVDLSGEEGEALLRRRAEALEALQQIVNTAFGASSRRPIVRRRLPGLPRRAKDAELKEMARFMMEKAKSTGVPQEMGPLNPYARASCTSRSPRIPRSRRRASATRS